jgi:serine protease Do
MNTNNKNHKAMKKLISSVFVAALGGVFALSANYYLNNSNLKAEAPSQVNYSPYHEAPVTLTTYAGTPAAPNTDFTFAAEKSLNAVVHIKTTIEQSNNITSPFEWYFGNGRHQPYVQEGIGSGVIISNDGYIVTNNHVVNGAQKIEVMLNDKRDYTAEVIGADPSTDIALIRIKEKDLPFIAYGNSDNVKVGEWVLAAGNPFNLNSTVTAGIISAKGRNINILESNRSPIESFIQTDAAINPGNSGGALVNTSGELIGINTAIASNNGAYQGYAFAVPVNIVKKIVADLAEFGYVQRAYVGVSIRDIDSKFAEQKNIKQLRGAYVNGLTSGGAAEESGIKIGDVLTSVESNKVTSVSEFQEQISKYRPSDKVNITLIRNEKEVIVPITLKNIDNTTGIIKKPVTEKVELVSLGTTFEAVDQEMLSKYKAENGVRVAKLNGGKLAGVGIKEGFIITTINKKKMSTIKDVQNSLEGKSGSILIEGFYPNGIWASYGFGL